MKPKIALVTVSGKAYYLMVNELKRRNATFLSLTPADNIPKDVMVVITTKEESSRISHEEVLEFEENQNPEKIIDEAIRIVKGKRLYEKLVIGIDPGENHFGVAALGDGEIIETKNCTSLNDTVATVVNILNDTPTTQISIRIGDGVPSKAEELWRQLNDALPEYISIESVEEEGTSKLLGEGSNRRGKRDVNSATKIAQRRGHKLPRRQQGG